MPTVAILVAAGAGVRMGAAVPKAVLPLAGRPMAAWSAEALDAAGDLAALVVVAPPGMEDDLARAVAGVRAPVAVVAGGASRADSVRLGLEAVPAGADLVLVHDAARPLVSPETVAAVIRGVEGADGAIAAAPVVDTLKRADGDAIGGTVGREGLWAAQTPQAFPPDVLREAVAAAVSAGTLHAATDCASLVEARGGRVRLVASSGPNPKVTTRADRDLAEAILAARGRG
jgi:2-C-methyl-D-erythritol 4-phosphate cytidylyltransferase